MIRSSETNRPQRWEDEAPAETRYRRVQQGVPPTGRTLPGMPQDMSDPEGEDSPRAGSVRYRAKRFDSRRGRWWRPASHWGRAFLGFCTLIVLGGLAFSFFFLKAYLARDGRFRIAGAENIETAGLAQVSRSDMLPVFGEDIGRNIFFVPLDERRKQLEQIPWIERATVMRLLPDRIRVSVVERTPIAFARLGQQIALVDASGIVLSMPAATMAQHHYSFPVVTGIDPADPLPARKARMAVYQRLLGELDANNQHFSEQISEIDLTDPEDARVLMPEQGADILVHLGEDRFLSRFQRYKANIATWRQQYPKVAAVDLRYDHDAVLEMGKGLEAPEAAGAQGQPGQSDAGTASGAKAAPEDTAKQNPPNTEPVKPVVKQVAKPVAKPKTAKSGGASGKPGTKIAPKTKSLAAGEAKKRADSKRTALPPKPTVNPKPAVKRTRPVAELGD